jgi:hypothetical protein
MQLKCNSWYTLLRINCWSLNTKENGLCTRHTRRVGKDLESLGGLKAVFQISTRHEQGSHKWQDASPLFY